MTVTLEKEITRIEKTAAGSKETSIKDAPVLTVRMCAKDNKKVPAFSKGDSLHIAFPTTIHSSVSMVVEFSVSRQPFVMVNPKSQKLRYCIEAKLSPSRVDPWTSAERAIINAAKSGPLKYLPYAFLPKEVAASGETLSNLDEVKDEVVVDCSLMPQLKAQSRGLSLFDSLDTVGIACNCDSSGSPVKDESACTNDKCEWRLSRRFCGVKK